MDHRDAVSLIDNPYLSNLKTPTHWADLGCGSGTFTLALAELLPPGSSIDAIDLHPSVPATGMITPRAADFTTLQFSKPQPNTQARAPIPARAWPGHEPLSYDGIIMANSLHYVSDQHSFLKNLKTNALLLIEYDIDMPVARWVPYPLSFATATRLLKSAGYPRIQKLGTQPSAFGRSDIYAALALPQE